MLPRMWKTIWRRSKDTWNVVRQLLAVRSLLDLLGWKGVVVAIGATAASVVSAYLRRVPAAALLTIGFSIGAVTMILFAFFRTYRRVSAAESSGRENSTQRAPIAETPTGPEIVVDYVYAEDDHDNHDANRPLLLKNLSATTQAYNVNVLPLQTGAGSVKWDPSVVPYIEAKGSRNVFADVSDAGGSPLFSRRLPDFLFKSYKDESIEELFGTKSYDLRVQYEAGAKKFETACELQFRPWKKQVKIGHVDRRDISSPNQ
jgi:hypothetical protein